MSAGIRSVLDARVGDTLTLKGKQGAQEALPGMPDSSLKQRVSF